MSHFTTAVILSGVARDIRKIYIAVIPRCRKYPLHVIRLHVCIGFGGGGREGGRETVCVESVCKYVCGAVIVVVTGNSFLLCWIRLIIT